MKFKWTAVEAGRAKTVISISKRVGSSPQRNRLKRLIRENLRQSPEWLDRPINLAIYVTGAPQTAPTLKEVACHLERFFRHLS
ncbi:MAG: hypothetical protein A2600_00065 [Candidatus Lambdaproteobacteria bacterium RIFOXYD1_FULL_56_27]|uniref:Uncharacterized protein n=1 Tax=Candidatus Lambdaproteobacteria bacterium RIFOXYD2_FULL_56_26 TaxID=1817773 RepID=A0A1F6GPP0_9PROT|nr:MAG: hypothetical protein A2557_04185 [Candidatus Lambdaproteobacteria bacterium RIFOXYD2_FULL_56_26]OGH03913.1 MAG: hypothetical protein A2426_07410 [Candidatus Lambdaproteobacteria bacterium RIFOXYC1_FULL_56_13]OGH06170.1 MAG: hypothetical protein A2600_00065 [Candidatus Lambdaproteobacteria bacterium RIFOXYD1_FULL_56_27]